MRCLSQNLVAFIHTPHTCMTMHKSTNTQWLDQATLSLNVHKCRKNYSNLLLHNVSGFLRIKQNGRIVVGSCENILVKIIIFTTHVR